MADRDFDLVLFGATGFTGKLVAQRLAAHPTLRWALAGRDLPKLERVRATLAETHPACAQLPLVVADAGDDAALAALAARTRVVCTTVGPYLRYGAPLVAACAAAGTDYCDLTGEALWVRAMIDAHHATARRTGARIVCCSGFDSIPSDLGAYLLQQEVRRRTGAPASEIRGYVMDLKGGVSGGTAQSMIAMAEQLERDRTAARQLVDLNLLCPGEPFLPDPAAHRRPTWDRRADVVTAPFIMAGINARVVRRSHWLAGGDAGFRYTEVMAFPKSAKGAASALGLTAALAGLLGAVAVPALRAQLGKRLPQPGTGPSPERQARGRFTVRFDALLPGGARASYQVADTSDPGYASTAKMLSESALALAFDPRQSDGGVVTPAFALGATLPDRLRAVGLTLAAV